MATKKAGAPTGAGPATSTKKGFSSVNLNALHKPVATPASVGAKPPPKGLVALTLQTKEKKLSSHASMMGHKPPMPTQLKSLKAENYGHDPGVSLVPSGGLGWGKKAELLSPPKTATVTPEAAPKAPARPKADAQKESREQRVEERPHRIEVNRDPKEVSTTTSKSSAGPSWMGWKPPKEGSASSSSRRAKDTEKNFPSLGREDTGDAEPGEATESTGSRQPARAVAKGKSWADQDGESDSEDERRLRRATADNRRAAASDGPTAKARQRSSSDGSNGPAAKTRAKTSEHVEKETDRGKNKEEVVVIKDYMKEKANRRAAERLAEEEQAAAEQKARTQEKLLELDRRAAARKKQQDEAKEAASAERASTTAGDGAETAPVRSAPAAKERAESWEENMVDEESAAKAVAAARAARAEAARAEADPSVSKGPGSQPTPRPDTRSDSRLVKLEGGKGKSGPAAKPKASPRPEAKQLEKAPSKPSGPPKGWNTSSTPAVETKLAGSYDFPAIGEVRPEAPKPEPKPEPKVEAFDEFPKGKGAKGKKGDSKGKWDNDGRHHYANQFEEPNGKGKKGKGKGKEPRRAREVQEGQEEHAEEAAKAEGDQEDDAGGPEVPKWQQRPPKPTRGDFDSDWRGGDNRWQDNRQEDKGKGGKKGKDAAPNGSTEPETGENGEAVEIGENEAAEAIGRGKGRGRADWEAKGRGKRKGGEEAWEEDGSWSRGKGRTAGYDTTEVQADEDSEEKGGTGKGKGKKGKKSKGKGTYDELSEQPEKDTVNDDGAEDQENTGKAGKKGKSKKGKEKGKNWETFGGEEDDGKGKGKGKGKSRGASRWVIKDSQQEYWYGKHGEDTWQTRGDENGWESSSRKKGKEAYGDWKSSWDGKDHDKSHGKSLQYADADGDKARGNRSERIVQHEEDPDSNAAAPAPAPANVAVPPPAPPPSPPVAERQPTGDRQAVGGKGKRPLESPQTEEARRPAASNAPAPSPRPAETQKPKAPIRSAASSAPVASLHPAEPQKPKDADARLVASLHPVDGQIAVGPGIVRVTGEDQDPDDEDADDFMTVKSKKHQKAEKAEKKRLAEEEAKKEAKRDAKRNRRKDVEEAARASRAPAGEDNEGAKQGPEGAQDTSGPSAEERAAFEAANSRALAAGSGEVLRGDASERSNESAGGASGSGSAPGPLPISAGFPSFGPFGNVGSIASQPPSEIGAIWERPSAAHSHVPGFGPALAPVGQSNQPAVSSGTGGMKRPLRPVGRPPPYPPPRYNRPLQRRLPLHNPPVAVATSESQSLTVPLRESRSVQQVSAETEANFAPSSSSTRCPQDSPPPPPPPPAIAPTVPASGRVSHDGRSSERGWATTVSGNAHADHHSGSLAEDDEKVPPRTGKSFYYADAKGKGKGKDKGKEGKDRGKDGKDGKDRGKDGKDGKDRGNAQRASYYPSQGGGRGQTKESWRGGGRDEASFSYEAGNAPKGRARGKGGRGASSAGWEDSDWRSGGGGKAADYQHGGGGKDSTPAGRGRGRGKGGAPAHLTENPRVEKPQGSSRPGKMTYRPKVPQESS